MDLNLKRFLAYYGKIILMPEILMSVYRCTHHIQTLAGLMCFPFRSSKYLFLRHCLTILTFPLVLSLALSTYLFAVVTTGLEGPFYPDRSFDPG